MANTIRDYSATAASNTVVDGADVSEGCSPAGINDAIRGVMADLKDVSTGAVALESPAMDSLTVDTTTLVVDAVNNRVGVGTASPATALDVTGTIKAKGGSISTQTTNAGLIANSSGKFVVNHGNEYGLYTGYINSTDDAIGIASTTNAGTAGPLVLQPFGGNVGIGTSAPSGAKLEIFTGSTAVDGLKINRYAPGNYYSTLRQDNHGLAIHVGIGGTVSERVAITPNGITFNGDTAAANALDDYEEGTWNVTIVNGGLTPSVTSASYTKIGNRVFLSCQILVPTNTEGQYMALGGLPFSTNGDSAGSLAYTTATTSDSIGLLVQGSTIYFYKDGQAYATSEFSNHQLRLSAQYRTS